MVDYDLGRAHGRVVIETDQRGPNEAVRQMRRMEAEAEVLAHTFSQIEGALESYERSMRELGSVSSNSHKEHSRLAATVRQLQGATVHVTSTVTAYTQTLVAATQAAVAANEQFVNLYETIQSLGSVSGTLSTLAGGIGSVGNELDGLSGWQRDIVQTARALRALSVTGGLVGRAAGGIAAMAASTAAFGFITPKLVTAGRGLKLFAGSMALIFPSVAAAGLALRNFAESTGRAGRDTVQFTRAARNVIDGASRMILGLGMAARGLAGVGRAAKLTALALSGVSVAGGAISALAALIAGLVNAIGQLSGVAGLLPGAMLGFGVALGVAKLATHGFSDAVKAAFGDASKFDEAIKELSPTMQGIAKAFKRVAPEFKALRDIAANQVFAGFERDIEAVSKTYLPALRTGVMQVGGSLNQVKNGLRDFLTQPATGQDLQRSFSLTAQILDNLAEAVWPLGAAFRDIAVVGLEVFADLSGGIDGAASKFGDFISEARRTGDLRTWIEEGIRGFQDLGRGISAVGSMIQTIWQAFGHDGENALQSFADAMERFDERLNQSADGGALEAIASSLQRMASTGVQVLGALGDQLVQFMENIAPAAEELSTTFGGSLVVVIQTLGAAFNALAAAIGSVPALGSMVGAILAMGIAMKGLALLVTPVIRAFQVLFGMTTAFRGMILAVGGLSTAMTTAAGRSTLMAAAMGKLQAAMGAAAAATALTAGLIAGTAVYLVAQAGLDNLAAGYERMAEAADLAEESAKGFTEAFMESNGVMSSLVLDEAISQIDDFRGKLEDLAGKAPGWKEAFADLRIDFGPGELGMFDTSHTQQFEELKTAAQDAQVAIDVLDNLGVSNKQLAQAVTGSNAAWQSFHDQLAAIGPEGVKAIDALLPFRQSFLDVQAAMDRVGTGGVQLANGIRDIGAAGDDASARLDGLKTALQGLGLIQTTAQQAAFDYQESLRQMGTEAQVAADRTLPLGNALLTTSGQLDATQQNAYNLNQALGDLANKFLDAANKGGNTQQMYQDMQPALQSLADSFGLPIDKIRQLIAQMGVVPSTVSTLVNLQGADEVQQDLAQVYLRAQQVNGTPITVSVNSQGAIDALRAVGAQISVYDQDTHTATLTLDPTKAQQALAALQAQIAATQIPAPNVEQPQTPPPAPPPTGEVPPLPAPKVEPPQTPNPVPPAVPPPAIPAPEVGTPVTPPVQPPPEPAPIPAPRVEAPVVPPLPEVPPPAPIALQITGVEGVVAGVGAINQALADSGQKWVEYNTAVTAAVANVANAVNTAASGIASSLNGAAASARTSGEVLGQGFADGISSKEAAVRAAALRLAEAAAEPLPRSPAKIGPFSGQGWTPYRGRALALGFAEGIDHGVPAARQATLDMAVAVASAMDQLRTAFQMPTTSFDANRMPGASGAKFYRDPEVTDADIAKRRADKQKAKDEEATLDARFKESDDRKKAEKEARANARESVEADKNGKRNAKSMEEIAKYFNLQITSNKRNEPGSFHNDGSAWDFAGSPEDMARLNAYLARTDPNARELFYDPGVNIDEGKRTGAIGGHSDHVHYAPSPSMMPGAQNTDPVKAIEKSNTDTKQGIIDAIVSEGKKRGLSDEDIAAGIATGLVESNLTDNIQGPDDSADVFQQRPSMGWGPDSDSVATDAGQFFDKYMETDPSKTPGQRAQDVQRSAYPDKYDQRMSEALALTQEALKRNGLESSTLTDYTADQLDVEEDVLATLRANNKALSDQIDIAQNPASSDADVIRALQSIEDEIAVTGDRELYNELQGIRDSVMEDRGIKKYDPFEGASTDPLADGVKIAQSLFGLLELFEGGIEGLSSITKQLVRGFQNTKDVNNFVDSIQSVVGTFGSIASTVGDLVSTAGSLAALAGMAIPGIGQVAAVVGALTGGIGTANAIVDLIQQGFKVAGRVFGGLLSGLAGGKNGPLMGDVKFLLDKNDNTLKSWSADNPDDKRVRQLGPAPSQVGDIYNGPRELIVYGGPGQDPRDTMDDAMFAVKANTMGTGVYSG